ncbi:MAG: helix-turn-helix transcriptional regulator [Oscillospiraceae bacterium]|nr:helix-turn-helix transcriptional regulator [Oscillospiraceae bacterium]
MQCVFFGDTTPSGFEEQLQFSMETPYTICIKQFQTEDIVPLHYADTIEILLCRELCGEIVIDTSHYPLQGNQLFLIPPYTIHSNNIRPGSGTMYVFKINLQEMGHYIQIENYLALYGCQLNQLLYQAPAYEEVLLIVEELMKKDGRLEACIPLFLDLMRILSRHTAPKRSSDSLHAKFKGSSLQELINWTNRNYPRKISIQEVASLTGYSKYHFCSRFKTLTGMTYMNYLNSVRVSYACWMLSSGESVQSVSRSTGFENTSHFIQTFKRIQHITPHQYACQKKSCFPRCRPMSNSLLRRAPKIAAVFFKCTKSQFRPSLMYRATLPECRRPRRFRLCTKRKPKGNWQGCKRHLGSTWVRSRFAFGWISRRQVPQKAKNPFLFRNGFFVCTLTSMVENSGIEPLTS